MKVVLVPFVLSTVVACTSIEREVRPLDSVTLPAIGSDAVARPPIRAMPAPLDASGDASETLRFAPPRADDGVGKPYTRVHLGWFDTRGDIDSLDDGFWGDVTFGRKVLGVLAVEGSVGYLEAGIPGGDKLWGIPLLVNGRVTLPIPVVEPYVGAGVGGIYAEFPGGTDFVFAYDAMAGVGVGLGQLQVGAEYRYLISDDLDPGFAIEGQSLSLFASLPF